MVAAIDQAHKDGDTLGGVVEVVVHGLPPGLGSHVHWDRRLDSKLAGALMGIQAIKGVEVGDGFALAADPGSKAHDEIVNTDEGIRRTSGRSGGTEGGMSTGEILRVRAAMKPIATVPRALKTVDMATGQAAVAHHQRSDVCAVPAAGDDHRGDGRPVRAGRRRGGEVRRRLGGRDRPQLRVVPRRAAAPVTAAANGPVVVLVGPMGAGKSTVAELLGAAWSQPVRDTDRDVEAAEGRSIADIFVDSGEETFRALERAAVAEALAAHRGVLASAGRRCWTPQPGGAGGPAGGVPAGRPRRRREAGRADIGTAAAARQCPGPDQGAPRQHAPSTSRWPGSPWTPMQTAPQRAM